MRSCKGVKYRLDLNKKPIFLAADFATEEMFSLQERSDAIEKPNTDGLSHIFRIFESKNPLSQGNFYFCASKLDKMESCLYLS